MVGGFIGALDNGIGRVGVAPGARLWAVRVLDDEGTGYTSEVICGLDWVTATRTDADPANDVRVANMSLGGPLGCLGLREASCPPALATEGECGATTNPLHIATCRATANNIALVVAAGNEGQDIAMLEPATFSEVLTVTAMADRDGQPGGLLPPPWNCDPTETSGDDAAAEWSNFATLPEDRVHTLAAPGVCISSTYLDGLYGVSSGTSFASPLVAGTVALCIAAGPCASLTPAQIVQKMTADAAAYNTARRNVGYGFQGDPLRPIADRYYGYLVRAALY
jgi:subtilisin